MDDHPSEEGPPEALREPNGEGEPGRPLGEAPDGPEARALALEAEEIRRLVESGAGTPEAIRDLAARLREHRAREEALWRSEVKPALVKEGKGRLRGHGSAERTPVERSMSNSLWAGLILLGLVVVVLVAANTTAWLLVLPLVGLVVWAWYQGRDSGSG